MSFSSVYFQPTPDQIDWRSLFQLQPSHLALHLGSSTSLDLFTLLATPRITSLHLTVGSVAIFSQVLSAICPSLDEKLIEIAPQLVSFGLRYWPTREGTAVNAEFQLTGLTRLLGRCKRLKRFRTSGVEGSVLLGVDHQLEVWEIEGELDKVWKDLERALVREKIGSIHVKRIIMIEAGRVRPVIGTDGQWVQLECQRRGILLKEEAREGGEEAV